MRLLCVFLNRIRLFSFLSVLCLSACNENYLDADAFVGKPFALTSYLEGYAAQHPVIVHFWATWCPPCVQELPSLNALAKKEVFPVVVVSIDADAEKAKQFLAKNKLNNFHTFYDEKGKKVFEAYPFLAVPTTFIVSPKGKVLSIEEGVRVWDHPEMIDKMRHISSEI